MATVLRGRLIALIEPLLAELGYELVELEYVPGRSQGVLRIFIDRPQMAARLATEDNVTVALDGDGQVASGEESRLRESGIGIDDCERVSHEVSALLDVEDPIPTSYTLEVSSPGEDRVLRTRAHFERFAGSRVHVELKTPREGRRRYTGLLRSVSEGGIELEVDRQAVSVPFDEIEKARLAPQAAGPMRR
ncbi:MAG: ribosome maturation factor RimP [Steroidobacteraceae bacterium]|nr:ribosome maturation factor RimP [Steroidobacteraceae bacterium]